MRKAGVFLSLCFVVMTVWGSDNESLPACFQQGNTFKSASLGRPQVVFISRKEGCEYSKKFDIDVWAVKTNQPAVVYTEVSIDQCRYMSSGEEITGTPTVLWYKGGGEVERCKTVGVESDAQRRFNVRMTSFLENLECKDVN